MCAHPPDGDGGAIATGQLFENTVKVSCTSLKVSRIYKNNWKEVWPAFKIMQIQKL